MGWRPGQGVGPRTYKDQPKKASRKGKNADFQDESNTFLENATVESVDLTSKVYGCPLPPPGALPKGSEEDEESSDSEIEDLDANVLFAPEDMESPLCNPKENTYGLGYKGLDRNALSAGHGHIDLFSSSLKFRVEDKKMNIKGEVSILNISRNYSFPVQGVSKLTVNFTVVNISIHITPTAEAS